MIISGLCYSQEKDTADISFKAKLLTIDRHGILNEAKLLEDIKKQKLEFIEYNDSNDWVFMKIKFDQKYGKHYDNSYVIWLGSCYFYIAYRKEESKFYRLGGFDALDIDDFINDFHNDTEYLDFLFNKELKKEIPIHCMESYVRQSGKKRLKKGYNCFQQCSDVLSTTLIVN